MRRSTRLWPVLLLALGCVEEPKPAPPEALEAVVEAEEEAEGEGVARREEVLPRHKVQFAEEPGFAARTPEAPPAVETPPAPARIQLGMDREALLGALGRCGYRVSFIPGGPGTKMLEVFQPQGQECVKEVGARHFKVLAGTLVEITPGLRSPAPPPAPPALESFRPQ